MIKQHKTNKTKTLFLNNVKEILIPLDEDYSEASWKCVWFTIPDLKCFLFYTFLSNTLILDFALLKMGGFQLKGKNVHLNWL